MMRKIFSAVLCFVGAMTLSAQVEVPTAEQQAEWLKVYEQAANANGTALQKHLARVGKSTTATRVYLDFAKVKDPGTILYYSVPAMSETQYLPNVYPFDGEPNKGFQIVSAQDEYEPGSVLLYALENMGKVQFEVSDLKGDNGAVFSKDNLDLKTVKVWYQNGNGWYSYFQDNSLKLCPELLLNDEDLILVDTKKVANFARLTEKDGKVSYRWLTAPRDVDTRVEDAPAYWLGESFSCMKENFQDAPAFKGATLNEGEFKQFFLTAHVKEGQKPGLYKGSVALKKNGQVLTKIPVALRVLPFVLPKPMTYANPYRPFPMFICDYISIEIISRLNGGDPVLARKQLVSLLKNFVAHNEPMPHYRGAYADPSIAREAGCDLSIQVTTGMSFTNLAEMRYDARRKAEEHKEKFGKIDGYYMSWGDEYGLSTLKMIRPMVDIYKEQGFRFTVNSHHGYAAGGYLGDLLWPPVNPDQESAKLGEKVGLLGGDTYLGWYASQHVGVENPAFIRRQYGLAPYRAGFTCHYNYAHHLDGYNDIRGNTYKAMNFVYGDGKGVIDTLSYEGYREGMDDIRYATLLQRLARPLVKSKNYQAAYAAKKALQMLAEMDSDSFDQDTARLEMIRHILILQSFSK